MIVILVIAILVAIAVPVYMSVTRRADRVRAESNRRIAESAATSVLYMDILAIGGNRWVDPVTEEPVNASYLAEKEPHINWVDVPHPDEWGPFSGIDPERFGQVMIVSGDDLGPDNDFAALALATVSRTGTVYYTMIIIDPGSGKMTIESGTFHWDEGPPEDPEDP